MREMLIGIAVLLLLGIVLIVRGAWLEGVALLAVGIGLAAATVATRGPRR